MASGLQPSLLHKPPQDCCCWMQPLPAGVGCFGLENFGGLSHLQCVPRNPHSLQGTADARSVQGHCAPFSRAPHHPTHSCQILLPHKCQAPSSTLHPKTHCQGAHAAQHSSKMNNRDTVTEPRHPRAVPLAPLAAAETGTSTAPGLVPPCCPSMGQEGFAPPVLLQDAPIPTGCQPQEPAPRCHSILGTAPRSLLQKSRLGVRSLPMATETQGWDLGQKAPTSPRTPVGRTICQAAPAPVSPTTPESQSPIPLMQPPRSR